MKPYFHETDLFTTQQQQRNHLLSMVKIVPTFIFHHGRRSTVDNETTTMRVRGISAAVMYCPSMMYSCTAWLQWKWLSFLLHCYHATNVAFSGSTLLAGQQEEHLAIKQEIEETR